MTERVVLILAEPDDVSSEFVGRQLRQRGCPVLRVSVADLARARWQHSPEGEGATTLVFADGRQVHDASIGVVLNRLASLALPAFAHASPADRDYAGAEFAALLSSWLHRLQVPVANWVSGDNPYAAARHPLGWHVLAAGQGIEVADFVVASSLRGGAGTGLRRVGGSAYPRGSDVAGWYRGGEAAGLALQWIHVFGDACCGLDEEKVLAARCVAFVRRLGLACAALGFVATAVGPCLVELEPRPPLEDDKVAGCCADWLQRALAVAS